MTGVAYSLNFASRKINYRSLLHSSDSGKQWNNSLYMFLRGAIKHGAETLPASLILADASQCYAGELLC